MGNLSVEISKEKIKKNARRIVGNAHISDYYRQLFEEYDLFEHKSDRLKSCFKFFDTDIFRGQHVRDIKRVGLCHDKFCINCQNQASLLRLAKYAPYLDDLLADHDIYHVVLTVPNCKFGQLKFTLDKMYRRFNLLSRQLFNNSRFAFYGIVGVVRSLEITISGRSFDTFEYHPHFHCLFVMKNGIRERRQHLNKYSFDCSHLKKDWLSKDGKRYFTDFEVLLQKVWCLVFNGRSVCSSALDDLSIGYSCYAENAKSRYHEVFKYATKGFFVENTFAFPYEVFKELFFALYRRKIIQGYGILNRFKFDDFSEYEAEDAYYDERLRLRKFEDPVQEYKNLNEIVKEIDEVKDIRYISKNAFRKFINYEKDKS